MMTKTDKFWLFILKFYLFIALISFGYFIDKNIWLAIANAVLVGEYMLIISHFNIKPFWIKIYPKHIREKYK